MEGLSARFAGSARDRVEGARKGVEERRQELEVAIRADVQRGVVTLTGSAPGREIRERAREIAESVPGVARVENRISLTPEPDVAGEGK
ncbi:MAG: BON domain-containing protein [Myxococcota bacterium]